MRIGSHTRRFLAYAQTVLLTIIISSGMLFMHKHRTSTGELVIHVHPYNIKKDLDGNKHHHSDDEIHFLDVVFQGSYLQSNFVEVTPPLPRHVPTQASDAAYSQVSSPEPLTLCLRGPPHRS